MKNFVIAQTNLSTCSLLHNFQVIQRRYDGSVNFTRSWDIYKSGFGRSDGEYWLGKYIRLYLFSLSTLFEVLVLLRKRDIADLLNLCT